MNVHYTGRQAELSEAHRKKLATKFDKIQKILGDRYQPEAHVILSQERRTFRAEVTLNFRHNTMVVECSGSDLFAAVQEALDKLEKQIIRNKDRWREKKRRNGPRREAVEETREAVPAPPENGRKPRIYRNTVTAAKPLTIEEALLELEQDDRDCIVYQDAEKGRLAVLFRRRDGHLELVEG
jgi:putative sigma-54 modulation protein